MRIYTRSGDDGSTGLYGGVRVSKADPRVEAYGSIDELNAVIGWVRATQIPAALDEVLTWSQERCFCVGAFLASAPGTDPGIEPLTEEDVTQLEAAIDRLEEDLEPLKTFILPGGCEAAARLHIARTVCRRAERALVALAQGDGAEMLYIRWVNRLSDTLFVQARWANAQAGQADVPWQPRTG